VEGARRTIKTLRRHWKIGKSAVEGCVTCGAILTTGKQGLKLYKRDSHNLSDSPGRNIASLALFTIRRELGKFQVSKDTNILNFVLLFKKPSLYKCVSSRAPSLISKRLIFRELY
jgi:hypothetical protein